MKQSKWNWWAFFFAPFYYAGYGDLTKGIVFALLNALIPFAGIAVAIYAGLKANEQLPVGEVEFSWKNVFIVLVVMVLTFVSISMTLGILQGGIS